MSEKSSQIPIEKQEIPVLAIELKPELNLRRESSIHTISTSDSSIVPKIKLNACIEKPQTFLTQSGETTSEVKDQLKKAQMFQEGKFLNSFIKKPEITSTQELPIASAQKPQMPYRDGLGIVHEEIPQFTSINISQSQLASVKQDRTVFMNQPQIFSATKLQPTCSRKYDATTCTKIPQVVAKKNSQSIVKKETETQNTELSTTRKPETTHFTIIRITNKKEAEELPDALLNESVIVPAEKHQIIHSKESEGATTKESKISTHPDNKIQVNSVKQSQSIHSKQLEVSRVKKKPKVRLNQNISVAK